MAAGSALRRPAPSARGAPGDAAGPQSLGRRGRSGGLAHPLILILHARRCAARSRAPGPAPSVAGRGRREAGPRAWESQEARPQDMGFGCTDGGLRGRALLNSLPCSGFTAFRNTCSTVDRTPNPAARIILSSDPTSTGSR